MGTILRGWAMTEDNEISDGIAKMRGGLAAFQAMGAEIMRPYYLALLAEAHGKLRQGKEALSLIAEAQATMNNSRECWWEAELYRLRGELMFEFAADQHSDTENQEAEMLLQKAVDVALHQKALSLELRAAMTLSRLWQKQGKEAEARQVLTRVYGGFSEGFDRADLLSAKSLLSELS